MDPCCRVVHAKFYHLHVAAEIEAHQTRQPFFPIFYCRVLVSCKQLPQSLLLADKSGTWCSLKLLKPVWFKVRRVVQRWYSAYLGSNEWLFEFLLPFYHVEAVCLFSSESHESS